VNQFQYPVGLALFNRPTYHEILLKSLSDQTVGIGAAPVIVHADSYEESYDQKIGRPDFTGLTADLIDLFLIPRGAIVLKPETNLGIARALTRLEDALFDCGDHQWVLVIEGDMILAPIALDVIGRTIAEAEKFSRISIINFDYRDWGDTSSKYPYARGHGTRIYALRRSHYLERRAAVESFNRLLDSKSYQELTYEEVLETLARHRIYPSNKLQDALRTATSVRFHKHQIAPKVRIAHHIGHYGHSNPYVEGRVPPPDARHLEFDTEARVEQLTRRNLYALHWVVRTRRARVFLRLTNHQRWLIIKSVLPFGK
jgi:hypothetical protein